MICWQACNYQALFSVTQDVSFHQCVNLGRFNTEKVVSFVPPDGEFELMKYRCNENISLPFRVIPVINELGRTRLEVKVAVKSSFNDKLFALNVVITIPMPDNTARADIQPSQGVRIKHIMPKKGHYSGLAAKGMV